MYRNPHQYRSIPVGVVVRRTPGVTRWAKHCWTVSGILPGAAQAEWHELRQEGDAVEYHIATPTLEMHGAETEAYLHGLHSETPSVYVVLRTSEAAETEWPLELVTITVSPYEAQDYTDSGEEIVERVAMPAQLMNWVWDFVEEFHEHEDFVKRKRDKKRIDLKDDGIGDARIVQMVDVYRAPSLARKERLN